MSEIRWLPSERSVSMPRSPRNASFSTLSFARFCGRSEGLPLDCPRRNFVKLLQRRREEPDGNENLISPLFLSFFFFFIGGLETHRLWPTFPKL